MNQNGTETVTFLAILSDLGTGLVMIPIIAILEQVAIAKAFGKFEFKMCLSIWFHYLRNSFKANGGKTDSTQEMIAVGLGSLFCSFFGCMPLTASFSRSSVLSASGGKTQFANFFNGKILIILCDAFRNFIIVNTFYRLCSIDRFKLPYADLFLHSEICSGSSDHRCRLLHDRI